MKPDTQMQKEGKVKNEVRKGKRESLLTNNSDNVINRCLPYAFTDILYMDKYDIESFTHKWGRRIQYSYEFPTEHVAMNVTIKLPLVVASFTIAFLFFCLLFVGLTVAYIICLSAYLPI